MTATPGTTMSGVRVVRGAEAPQLHESGVAGSDFGTHTELREVATRLATSECSLTRLLLHSTEDQGGISIVYLYFKPNFPLFRHQHDVDSTYVVISGTAVDFMGEETLYPGDCWFVSAGTPYWYTAGSDGVEVLEMFRGGDSLTVIYADNPEGRLEESQEAVRANAEAWKTITAGPLFAANDAAR
jgi:mannose-6-phosphate isomerase-like protein (cupin superfamily)